MATIVELRSASRDGTAKFGHPNDRKLHSADGAQRASAEILMFTGVRYERWGDAPAHTEGRHTGVRDRLELED